MSPSKDTDSPIADCLPCPPAGGETSSYTTSTSENSSGDPSNADAVGLEIFSDNTMAIIGNLSGPMTGWDNVCGSNGGSLRTAYLAYFSNDLTSNSWVSPLDNDGDCSTAPNYASFTSGVDISIDDDDQAFLYGEFRGLEVLWTADPNDPPVSAPGSSTQEDHAWVARADGFSSSGFTLDWMQSVIPNGQVGIDAVAITSGPTNNYIIGDFAEEIDFHSSQLTGPDATYSTVASFVARMGTDPYGDPNLGEFFKRAVHENHESQMSTEDVVVFPNPTSGKFTVSWPSTEGSASIRIFDFSGRMVYNEAEFPAESGTMVLSTESMARGSYFVELSINENLYRLQLVKQ